MALRPLFCAVFASFSRLGKRGKVRPVSQPFPKQIKEI